MRLEPITMPMVNWSAFNEATNIVLGEQITKELDRQKVKLDSPASFAHALTFGEKDTFKHRLDHVNVSFVGFAEDEEVLDLVNKTSLSLATAGGKGRFKHQHLVVLTGNINQWVSACVTYCSCDQEYDMRKCFNDVFMTLQRQGFKDICERYNKSVNQDETFVLEVM